MGKALTAAKRAKMPKKVFAVKKARPTGKPGFPLNDKKHDRLAIGGATRSYNAGNISKSTETRIKAEARSKLGTKPMADKKDAGRKKDHHGMPRLQTKENLAKRGVDEARAGGGKAPERKTGGTNGKGRFAGMC